MARWARLAARGQGVLLVDDTHADVVPYMLAADVLVSDASSVIFEFLALDRPIVLVTNPRHRADPAYAPGDIVWRWRDLGDEVHEASDLPRAVAAALSAPDRLAERRRECARLLFGPFTDGRNHTRVAEKILALEGAPPAPQPPTPRRAHPLGSGGTGAGVCRCHRQCAVCFSALSKDSGSAPGVARCAREIPATRPLESSGPCPLQSSARRMPPWPSVHGP